MKVVIAGELPLLPEVGQLCVQAGHDTSLYLVEDFLGAVESGYLLDSVTDAEIVLEMHNESAATKQELLLALDHASPAGTLFLTTAFPTTTTQAATWVLDPGRVVGFGLLPPLQNAGMVELAPAMQTTEAALNQADLFWRGLGLTPVLVGDGPGLVSARLACCLINEAANLLAERLARAEEVDRLLRYHTGRDLGPLAWADQIGLDTVLGVMSGLFETTGDGRYRPSPLLKRLVLAGRLGQKTGRGFFTYENA